MASGYGTINQGAELTREDVATFLVQPLQARAVVLASGPQIFDTDGVPLRIPRISNVPITDAWRSENTLIDEVDPTFDELTLLPSSLKSLKVIHRFSNELARHSAIDLVTALQNALVTKIANLLDAAFLFGDGAAGTITGIANVDGVQEMLAVGSVSVDDLHDAEGLLLAANGDPTTAAWFLSPRSLTTLRKLRDGSGGAGTGSYLLAPDVTAAGRYTLLGHPVYVTTQIPNDQGVGDNESSVILVDTSRVAVGRDNDFTAKVLEERYADYDQLALRITARFDIGLLNAEACVVLRGVTA